MRPLAAKKTWVVVLKGAHASICERASADGSLRPIRDFAPSATDQDAVLSVARWLDVARRERAFERFLLVAPENDTRHLLALLSRPTRALLAATSPEARGDCAAEIAS